MLTIVVRAALTRDANGHPQWGNVGITFVSFVLWVYVLNRHLPGLELPLEYQSQWPVLLMISWVLVLPVIYRGDTVERQG